MTLNTTTTKAPVGPPIWKRLQPSAEIRKPATTAVTRPLSGVAPDAIASAIASGRATTDTVRPAGASLLKWELPRSEERSEGNEYVSKCRYRWTPYLSKKTETIIENLQRRLT